MIKMPPAKLIAKYLITQKIGHPHNEKRDWVIYTHNMAASPDRAICVYDIDADQDGRLQRTGERIEHPLFQIRIRGKRYSLAWSKGWDILNALDAIDNVTVYRNGVGYVIETVTRTSALLPLGTDPDTGLLNFTVNAKMTVNLAPAI